MLTFLLSFLRICRLRMKTFHQTLNTFLLIGKQNSVFIYLKFNVLFTKQKVYKQKNQSVQWSNAWLHGQLNSILYLIYSRLFLTVKPNCIFQQFLELDLLALLESFSLSTLLSVRTQHQVTIQ